MGSTPSGIDQSTLYNTSLNPPYYVNFVWKEGGQSVFFCGSFNSWRERVQLLQTSPGVWEAQRELTPGTYQFKFVVDGQWRCSGSYEYVRDSNGNLNNYIVVKQYAEPIVPKNAYNDPCQKQMQYIEQMFSTVIPEYPYTVWTTFPYELPRYLVKTPLNSYIENEAYQPSNLLPIPDHVVLTHFFKYKKRKNFTITASTARYRSKYVTVVLYMSNECETCNHCYELADVYHKVYYEIRTK